MPELPGLFSGQFRPSRFIAKKKQVLNSQAFKRLPNRFIMLSFYFILLGTYLFYARSKYFPETIFRPLFVGSNLAGLIFLLAGSAIFILSNGWAGGLLLTLAGASLAMVMIQFFAVLGKIYFYGLMALVHCLVLIQLISYAR